METLNNDFANLNLDEYALTAAEMICVRGGDDDPIINPPEPPIKIMI